MTAPKPPKKRAPAVGSPIARPIAPPQPDEILDEVQSDLFLEKVAKQAEQDSQKLEEFQSTFGGKDYYVRAEKYNEKTSEMEIVDKIFLDNFDPYTLGKQYGGGRFVCTLLDQRGKYVEGGRFRFSFAKAPVENSAPTAPAVVDPMANPMIVMMLENARADKLALMEMVKTIMTGEKSTPVDQIIAAVKNIHDMNPKPKEENSIKNLKELLELQALISDRDDKGSSSGGIVSEVLEAVKALGAAKGMVVPQPLQPPRPQVTRQILPTNGIPIIRKDPESKPTEEKPVPSLNDDPVYKRIAPHIPLFIEAASENAAVDTWADYLMGVLDTQIVPALVKKYFGVVNADEVWDKLVEAANDPEKVAKIYEYAPELQPYAEWTQNVVNAAVASFDQPEPDEVAVPTTTNGVTENN